ncbi:DEKNAAC103361 [Brettanomyces naardenensis]|uniref:Cytochrome b mRNA-processing protein 4 n=1 Tax=Brettanomyces naardenensis TaxID=13370 RepID=A0A448YND8_BRENA|nr:DEKNAAC103361 [Brettanomyces naardenensis]
MDPVSKSQWIRSLAWGGGIVGLGYVLFKFTTPTPEQLLAKMSPELRADVEKNRALRMKEQEELIKVVKETSKSNDPIWMTGSIANPWDKDFKKTADSLLVKKQDFERARAEEKQKKVLSALKEDIKKTEELEAKEKERRGWFW